MDLENIPAELRTRYGWVAWDWKRNVAVCCRDSLDAHLTDPSTWSDFATAAAYCRENDLGIAFALAGDPGHVVVELHGGRDPETGQMASLAKEIVTSLGSYADLYPTGEGMRAVVRGRLPVGTCEFFSGALEVYDRFRFVPLTGACWPEGPTAIGGDEGLRALWEKYFAAWARGTVADYSPSDEEVVRLATRREDTKLCRLWQGRTKGYARDGADLALFCLLAYWTHRDPDRMVALFDRSALARRKKWRGPDYLGRTLHKALTLTRVTKENQETQGTPGDTGINTRRSTAARFVHEEDGLDSLPCVSTPPPKAVPCTNPSPTNKVEYHTQGQEHAMSLADGLKGLPRWRSSFTLARRLRASSADNPDQYGPTVRAVCELIGEDPEEFWLAFLASWPKVKVAEGDDVLGWAARRAVERPLTPSPCVSPKYAQLASIAYYLAEQTHPKPFFLPCKRLAGILGTTAMTVSNIIRLLRENDVVLCVEENYKYAEHKGKEYILGKARLAR